MIISQISQVINFHALADCIGLTSEIIIGVATLTLIARFLVAWNLATQKIEKLGQKAPSAPYWAPLGIDLFATVISRFLRNEFFTWTRQILDVPGRTVALNLCGVSLVMTDDPDNIKALLSTKFNDFGKGKAFHKIWHELLLDSAMTTDGAIWHENVQYLRDHTAKIRPTDYAISERHMRLLIRNLSDGQAHDCLDQIHRYSLDAISDIFFGESADTLSAEHQPLRDAIEKISHWNTIRTLMGTLGAFLPGSPSSSAVVNNYVDHTIGRALSVPVTDPDESSRTDQSMIKLLALRGLSTKRIKDQVMAVLLGAKDPSSITIVWIIYELARHPQVVEALRAEITSIVGLSTLPTMAQLRSISLLQHIIKETLRLHHPLGFNIRTALTDTWLPTGGGANGKERVRILKGTHVAMSYMGLQRRHDIVGPTADVFDPFRWGSWTPSPWQFLPFNRGPRMCLGKNFAWMQMEYVICRLFQTFEGVELVAEDGCTVKGKEEEMRVKVALNTKPAEPVLVRFRQGKPAAESRS